MEITTAQLLGSRCQRGDNAMRRIIYGEGKTGTFAEIEAWRLFINSRQDWVIKQIAKKLNSPTTLEGVADEQARRPEAQLIADTAKADELLDAKELERQEHVTGYTDEG